MAVDDWVVPDQQKQPPPKAGGDDWVTPSPPSATKPGPITAEPPDRKRPEPEPATTLPGLAASVTRAWAPYAAGAATGAALGAPFAGVGAVPGALAGIGATGLTEGAGWLYNALKPKQWSEMLTPGAVSDELLDALGVRRPATTLERGVERASGMFMPGALVAPSAGRAVATLPEAWAGRQAALADRLIDRAYSQAVKPSTRGRDTALQRRTGMNDIISNKENLEYRDMEGSVTSKGRLPRSLREFGEAIDQVKTRFLEEWTKWAEKSGASGAKVDLRRIAVELRKYASDPALVGEAPEVAQAALEKAARYEKDGLISPLEAQRRLVVLNQKLRPYYKNPVPISPADEESARLLRQELNTTIEGTIGPGYQDMRNRFGALAAMEDDVKAATRRVANQTSGGGITSPVAKLGYWGGLAESLAHGDIKGLVASQIFRGLSEADKARMHPDRLVKRMFERAEKYHKGELPDAGDLDEFGSLVDPGMQPPRPTGLGQRIYGRTGPFGVASGGRAIEGPIPDQFAPIIGPGLQPVRPTGPGQRIYGRTPPTNDPSRVIPGGGSAVEAPPLKTPLAPRRTPLTEDFQTIPGGGFVGP